MRWGKNGKFLSLKDSTSIKRKPCDLLNQRAMFSSIFHWFRKVCSISGFVYCVFFCGTNKLEPKKPDALAGHTERVYSRPFSSLGTADVFFSLRTTRLRIVGLINEISTKRIHIEEKIWGNFSSICLRSQWFITPCCLIISETINVLMTVDACRVLLLLLSGSSQESMLWRALS